jgi:hypothetical protein
MEAQNDCTSPSSSWDWPWWLLPAFAVTIVAVEACSPALLGSLFVCMSFSRSHSVSFSLTQRVWHRWSAKRSTRRAAGWAGSAG